MRIRFQALRPLALCLAALPSALQAQIVSDGGFDSQAAGVSQHCTTTACPSGAWSLDGAAGFVHDGSTAWLNPNAVSTAHALWLQGSWGVARQSITPSATGKYVVSFWVASRGDYGWFAGNQIVHVYVGGQLLSRLPLTSGLPYRRYVSGAIQLIGGTSYWLEIVGSNQGDNTAFVDSVSLVAATSTTSYQYDALGRLTGVNQTGGANAGTSGSYTLDAAGNRTQVTVSGAN